MKISSVITPSQLKEFLLNVAVVRPVFIWGPPGIGKSSIVESFAKDVGMPCISLLGSQLAPEDLIGVPQIVNGKSRFCPPRNIAREEQYCLFLDELNACSHEVQKAFYSLIHERRIGEYHLPKGSIVIGAGNRAEDSAIVKTMSSALINRMLHVQLKASHRDWLVWAQANELHPHVVEYIQNRPDHLWSKPKKHEEPFSTPRSWHMLSDALKSYGDEIPEDSLTVLANSCLTPQHAGQFKAFVKQLKSHYRIAHILKGEMKWPQDPADRDILYYLAQSFRAHLVKELPEDRGQLNGHHKQLAHISKSLIKDLARISYEMAQLIVADDENNQSLPSWFLIEIVRDLPRLVRKDGNVP